MIGLTGGATAAPVAVVVALDPSWSHGGGGGLLEGAGGVVEAGAVGVVVAREGPVVVHVEGVTAVFRVGAAGGFGGGRVVYYKVQITIQYISSKSLS